MNRASLFLKKLMAFLRWGDLFTTSQFLRYRGESDYGTATGGFTSIAVLIVFVILFANLGLQTARRELINSSVSQQSETDPSPMEIVVGPEGGFIFLIGIAGLNLNDPMISYFDISLTQNYFGPLLTPINSTVIPLEQCTMAHFDFNPSIIDYFQRFTINWALCPPKGTKLAVQGRITSDIFSQFMVRVSKCNSTVNPKCAPAPLMAAIQQRMGFFRIGMPMVTTLINPGDQDYVKYYVEDSNIFYFTLDTQAVAAIGQLAQIEVDTDISLMPYQEIMTEYFVGLPQMFNAQTIPIVNDLYAQISFNKAATFPVYTRSFSKVDDYLSYVGGLVSTVLLLFFILSAYSSFSYLLEIASKSLQVAAGKRASAGSVNFLHYFMVAIKDLLSVCCQGPNWPLIDQLRNCRDQAQKQLDVSYIISRINYLEDVVSVQLKQHQLASLHLKSKPTIQQATSARKRHKALKILSQAAKERKEKAKQKGSSPSASIELNQSSDSPKKVADEDEESDQERFCDLIFESSDEQGQQQTLNELLASYKTLIKENMIPQSISILEGIDKKAKSRLIPHQKQTRTHQISIKNLNSFSFEELQVRDRKVSGGGGEFQFMT